MALEAGRLHFTLEFGKDLKDRDWFGRQDPYAKLTCGGQQVRSRTHIDGGRNPVWNQTFTFNVINENNVEVQLWDSDSMSRDDLIGTCTVSLARARQFGSDHQQVPVQCSRHHKQRGFVSVSMRFEPNMPRPGGYAPQQSFYQPQPGPYAPQPGYATPPQPAYAPPPQPAYYQPPAPAYAAPPAPAYAPPPAQPYYAPAPTQSYAQGALMGQPYPQAAPATAGYPPQAAHYPGAAPAAPGYYPAPPGPPAPIKFY